MATIPSLQEHRLERVESEAQASVCVSLPKRQKSPLKLTAEQVALVLTKLEFRDQLLVFLDTGLGTRRGELGALRWMDCNFDNQTFDIQHSYYWRRGGTCRHKVGGFGSAASDAARAERWPSGVEITESDFIFASEKLKGRKPLDLSAVLKKKIQPAFENMGIAGVG